MDPALILLAGLAVVLILQVTRVGRQRKDIRETQASLEVGVEVLTAAGMIGTVAEVSDDTVTLVSDDGHRTRWVRGSVVRVLTREHDPAPPAPGPDSPSST